MVWKKCEITSGDEIFIVLGEIFGVVVLTILKCAKSRKLVSVVMFSATGG
jgi:hypothetical protein